MSGEVVPRWGRVLPWLLGAVGGACFGWALDLPWWRLVAFIIGLAAWDLCIKVIELNEQADRGDL